MALLDRRLHTQVASDEEKAIKAAADAEGRPVSSFIRRAVLNSLAIQSNAKAAPGERGNGQMVANSAKSLARKYVEPRMKK